MDPLTAFSLAASVVQMVEIGAKIGKRLIDYVQAHAGDCPKPLENIATLLPLIIKSLSAMQDEIKVKELDSDTRVIVHGVVLGCFKLARELDEIANKITLQPGENMGGKLKKALGSMKYEERIKDIDKGLQSYIHVLILHQVVNKSDVQVKSSSDDKKYFEVKLKRVAAPILRTELISRLHESFETIVQGQRDTPLYVFLQGKEGHGKSQVALEYCYEAQALEHYRAIFWLDTSTPQSLQLGIENMASIIRQSKSGTSQEKIEFVGSFLAERWYPWLLVLDNYNPQEFNERSLMSHLPIVGHGAMLVTTRATTISEKVSIVKVHKFMTEDEDYDLRYDVSVAIRSKKLDVLVDAFENGLDVNSQSADIFNRKHGSLINLAAECGFDDAVRLFLDLGASPRLIPNHGSILTVAAYAGHPSILSIYFDHEDATGYVCAPDDYNYSVRSALQEGHLNVLKALLSRREDRVDPTSHLVGEGFASAMANGHIECIRLLQSHNKIPLSGGATALEKAINRSNLDLVKWLVEEVHIDLNDFNSQGESALNTAVYCRMPSDAPPGIRETIVQFLLDKGASPNLQDRRRGSTAVSMAAYEDSVDSLKILLQHGGDPTIEIDNGQNALERAIDCRSTKVLPVFAKCQIEDPEKRRKWHARALHVASNADSRELMLELIKETDINLTWGPHEDTPLLTAIKASKLPVARMLVRNGALQTPGKDGKIPLLLAAARGLDLLIKDLMKAKDFPGIEVTDEQGFTSLMLATKHRHEKTVKTLLSLGADKEAMNQFAETAVDIAEDSGHKEIIEMFEKI